MILPPEAWMDLRRFKPLREVGATWKEIAAQVGCDPRTVKKYIFALMAGPAIGPARKLATAAWLSRRMFITGLTDRDIAPERDKAGEVLEACWGRVRTRLTTSSVGASSSVIAREPRIVADAIMGVVTSSRTGAVGSLSLASRRSSIRAMFSGSADSSNPSMVAMKGSGLRASPGLSREGVLTGCLSTDRVSIN
jgi:hypothetical protein